ncbi:MAG: leucine-rich repeat protein [Oscillospiraceae bacterium]|nr:leucine-rich repeat protein [Oscillospiraceae bacterium]
MNRTTKILGLLIAAAFLFSAAPPMPDAVASDAGNFVVDGGGTLTAYRGSAADIVIPDSVHYIADGVFRGMTFIRSVTFHDLVVSIGRRAFEGCTGLTSVRIPNRVTFISTAAFSGCTSLTSVTLHPYLRTIGAEAFLDCPITSLEIPYSVTAIGMSAFRGNRLSSVHIPSVVRDIGDFAFTSEPNPGFLGASGSAAESYARTFNHPFTATPDSPPPAPPELPSLNLPPRTIRNDPTTQLPRYKGPGAAPAAWAVQAVNHLFQNTAIDDAYFADYGQGVSREEAAYYMVHTYFAVTGKPVDLSSPGELFADTDSVYAAKARSLGLMSGTDAERNEFTPDTILTREQTTSILINLLDVAGVAYNKDSTDHIVFADHSQVSGWALSALRRAYHLGLISGTTSGSPPPVNPQGELSREQLYAMLYNLFVSLNKIEDDFTRGDVIEPPQLVYSGIGKHPEGNIDEAFYSAPAVADIDGDGKVEIIYSSTFIYCVDALTGNVKWQVPSGYDQSAPIGTRPIGGFSNPDVILTDVDGDGALDIVVGHQVLYENGVALSASQRKGIVAVYDANGYFKPGWPKTLPYAVNSVAAGDLTGDGRANIVVGLVRSSPLDIVYAYDHAGNLMPGWPQLNGSTNGHSSSDRAASGYLYGLQNNTIAIGDIDGSGRNSVVVPTDMRHIPVFSASGALVKANDIFGGRNWGRVGTWLDYGFEKLVENEGFGFGNQVWSSELGKLEKRPWDEIPAEKRLFANFVQSPAVIADVDGNGRNEVVVIGTVSDQAYQFPDPPLFEAPFIFNGDRTRFQTAQYDWTTVPTNAGPILTHSYQEIQLAQLRPVVADVNADGVNDILFNSMSGKVMCYSLDQAFMWSYWINDRDSHTIEIASPLAAYDLNNNGFSEIIFATNTPYESSQAGRLIILNFSGSKLAEVELPKAFSSWAAAGRTNGVIARPVVTEINGDIYIILSTSYAGLTVYKL